MGKLQKRARKFSKKNLLLVTKKRRKLNAFFKKKAAKREIPCKFQDVEQDDIHVANERSIKVENIGDLSLDSMFGEDFNDVLENDSDNDEYFLEEKSFCSDDEIDSKSSQIIRKGLLLSSSAFDSLCQLVLTEHKISAMESLLNWYNAACCYGTESHYVFDDCRTCSNLLLFMLREADGVFRKILGPSFSIAKKDSFMELKNNSKWRTLNRLVGSYLRSTLFLINEMADSDILAFALSRLRVSLLFFVSFPRLLQRLIMAVIHLWATGQKKVSEHSFLVIQDVMVVFNSNCYETCLLRACKAFICHCKFVDPVQFSHLRFLKNSLLELCSQDVQKSYHKACVSIQQLAKILQLGVQTRKMEMVQQICSWQYISCIDLWVAYVSTNFHCGNLQSLFCTIIQIVYGVALLFSGPRFMPLRVKCVQWLNYLSNSSGVFIPVASLVLDILDYRMIKHDSKLGKDGNYSSVIKLPKHVLKSCDFQEDCALSAVQLLAGHFAQWSHHISFPELATIPLIYLKKFLQKTSIENSRRLVKYFIDQVENNVEFVQRNRDEASFSPKDESSVESFLQLENSSGATSFKQYYRSITEKSNHYCLFM